MPAPTPRGGGGEALVRVRRHTKLVCTIGPASLDRVRELVESGMDVARVNFSHGTPESRERAVREVRRVSAEAGRHVAVIADLPGPKVRLGDLQGETVGLRAGDEFVLRPPGRDGDERGAATTYGRLATEVRAGDPILLADGAVELLVDRTDGDEVWCTVVRGGRIRSRAGVNAPSERLSLPAVTSRDAEALRQSIDLRVDAVAQSFVRSAADVAELVELMGVHRLPVVAKIETRPAVENIAAILAVVDEIMVARGDLGVEMPLEQLPVIQKSLVREAACSGTGAIVATQMLESMTASPRPTRAEASDVANAVWDGADAIMLSAETAVGEYPVESARTAAAVLAQAERGGAEHLPTWERPSGPTGAESIARAAVTLAETNPNVSAIVCFTMAGTTARLLSSVRPAVPILAFSPDERVLRQLAVRRSVLPFRCGQPADTDAMVRDVDAQLLRRGLVERGRTVVIVASTPLGTGTPNHIKLHTVGG